MTQQSILHLVINWEVFNHKFNETSTFVKFNRWEGGYDHVLQPLQGAQICHYVVILRYWKESF